MSKIIVPLHLANLYSTPNGVDTGFKKFYLKSGWLKLYDGASEIDVVLDRPLDGYNPTNGVISPSDTVLSAIEKLGYGISYITNPQWGTISGNILSQTDLIAYIASISGTLQSVTDAGNTTTNDIIIDSLLYESIISNNYISVTTKGSLSGIGLLSSGVISFGNGSVYSYLSSDVTNLNVYFKLPNKVAGIYTLATTADIPAPTVIGFEQNFLLMGA
jgi:hypothetical protein